MGGKNTEDHMDTYSELNNYILNICLKVSFVAGRGLNEAAWDRRPVGRKFESGTSVPPFCHSPAFVLKRIHRRLPITVDRWIAPGLGSERMVSISTGCQLTCGFYQYLHTTPSSNSIPTVPKLYGGNFFIAYL